MISRNEMAASLYKRRQMAVRIRRACVRSGDWQPEPKKCHRNVEVWCSRHPNYMAVQGWLVADYEELGIYQFFAHSVVEDETGNLIDITPNPMPYSYPFLRHDEADGRFIEFEDITSVIYRMR